MGNVHIRIESLSLLTCHVNQGSGIFVSPKIVLRATGSVGASLFLWTLGAIAAVAGLLVWLELGMSIPKFQPPESPNELRREGERPFVSIPRNGGEKNYVGLSTDCAWRLILTPISSSISIKIRDFAQHACMA